MSGVEAVIELKITTEIESENKEAQIDDKVSVHPSEPATIERDLIAFSLSLLN